MQKKLLYLALTALVFVGCNKDNNAPSVKATKHVTITCNAFSGSNDVRQVQGRGNGTSGIDFDWNTLDQVIVKVGNETSVFTLVGKGGTDKESYDFEGDIPQDATEYEAYYPSVDAPSLTEQTYVKGGIDATKMYAKTEENGTLDGGFTLYTQMAALCLNLKGIERVGTIIVTIGAKTYTLNCKGADGTGAKLSKTEAKPFYIMVDPAENVQFTATIKAVDGNIIEELTPSQPKTFVKGKVLNMDAKMIKRTITHYFSVSSTKKIQFAPGNLQYQASTRTWRFAEHQYDYVGDVSVGTVKENSVKCNNALMSTTYSGWIDLFGWGVAHSNPTHVNLDDIKNCTGFPDVAYFEDWGKEIDGGLIWFTLSRSEWEYLVDNARGCGTYGFGMGKVNNIYGIFLLPDNWVKPSEITFTYGAGQWINGNNFTLDQWNNYLEPSGVVFLPASGKRNTTSIMGPNNPTYSDDFKYWSCTQRGTDSDITRNQASTFCFAAGTGLWVTDASTFNCYKNYGLPVRLAKDVTRVIKEEEDPTEEESDPISEDDATSVTLNSYDLTGSTATSWDN